MKAKEINGVCNSLRSLKSKKIPANLALIIGRNLRELETAEKDINAQRDDLIERYADKDEDGKVIITDNKVHIKDIKEFTDEENSLYETDLNINLEKISMSDVERCENPPFDALSMEEVMALECMLE